MDDKMPREAVETNGVSSGGTDTVVSDLVVAQRPSKTTYRAGETVDLSGLRVTCQGVDVTSRARFNIPDDEVWRASDKRRIVEVTYIDDAGQAHGTQVELKRRMPVWPWIVAALVAIAVILAVVFALLDPWGDPRAKAGYYEGKTDEEIQQDLNEQVDWYSMQMSCAPYVVVSPGSTHVPEINIENIEANHCDQKVTVTLKNTGEVLYESGAISPGYYIPDVEFSRSFDEGVYEALVTFQGYEREARIGGGGQLWGHDEFGAPSRLEILIIVTDDENVARATAAHYLE